MGKDLAGKEVGRGIHQLKNGTYEGRYTDFRSKRISIYDRNLFRLKNKLDAAKKKNGKGVLQPGNYTLSSWFCVWFDVYKQKTIKKTTEASYHNVFNKHIAPVLGGKKLQDITHLDCKMLVKSLDEQGLRYATQHNVCVILYDMFEKALLDEFVYRNPAQGVRPIASAAAERRVLSVQEQLDFFSACSGTFYDSLFITAVNTGLRIGELSGLFVEDVDFEGGELHVRRTVVYQRYVDEENCTFHLEEPKTALSKRVVPMTRQCVEALKRQIDVRNNVFSRLKTVPREGFERIIFCTPSGEPLRSVDANRAVSQVVTELNKMRGDDNQFEPFTFHAFRHTFATRCFEAGMSPKTVQTLLGHYSIRTTMDLYTHATPDKIQEDMLLLESSLANIVSFSSRKMANDVVRSQKA